MKSELIEVLPPREEFNGGWPRIYKVPGYSIYYLCIKPYSGSSTAINSSVFQMKLTGGMASENIYTCIQNIEEDVANGKLEQVPNRLRLLIEVG